MESSVQPATYGQVAQFMTALLTRGVGEQEIEAANADRALMTRIASQLRGEPDRSFVDISGEFEQRAMKRAAKRLLAGTYKDYKNSQRRHQAHSESSEGIPEGYGWTEGVAPEELATSDIFRYLLDGLSDQHAAVAVWRSGLLDGKEVSVGEVAERLGISESGAMKLRSEATRHMQTRLFGKAEYRLRQYVHQSPELRSEETSIEDLKLDVRIYNALRREGVSTIEQLARLSEDELRTIRTLGSGSIGEIRAALGARGIELS